MNENTSASANPTEMFDRSRAPLNLSAIETHFPEPVSVILPNGLKIFLFEQHETPLVSARLYMRAGLIHEGERLRLSALTFALLPQGTQTRRAEQIADEVEFLGADLTASGSIDTASVSLSVMSKHLSKGLALFADVARNPTFAESEVEFVRKQSISRLQFSKSDATRLSNDAFAKAVFGSHPYGKPALGTEPALRALTRNDFVNFYTRHALPNTAFITVAGDIDAQKVKGELTTAFGDWATQTPETFSYPATPVISSPKVILVQKEGAVQSVVNIGHLGVPRRHPDYVKLYVMNMILGGYFGSRLNMNLREKQGFTYGIRSDFDSDLLGGVFNINTQVRNDVTAEAIRQILHEVKQIQTELVSVDELSDVKQYITGNFVIQNESPATIINRVAAMELYGLPASYYKNFSLTVHSVTREEVLQMAQTYINPKAFYIVVAGDAKRLTGDLRQFGDVETHDADGNTLNSL
jgi:zinc protease